MQQHIKIWLGKPFFKTLWPAILWAIFIFALSTIKFPERPTQISIPYLDKLAHAVLYAILSALIVNFKQLNSLKINLSILIASVYGIVMELVQHYYIAHRYFEVTDILANCLGAIIGVLVLLNIKK